MKIFIFKSNCVNIFTSGRRIFIPIKPIKRSLAMLAEQRNKRYAILSDAHLNFFEKILSKSQLITDSQILESFNIDWLKTCQGNSKLALLPRTTHELSIILKYCNDNNLAVCPQGGNTGAVGGGVPAYDEIIISTKLMNSIIDLNPESNILKCQSGCVLQTLDEYVEKEAGLMMPLDLGAKGSCHIGGNVSTNAGGLRLLRYGSLKGNVLGLEVVLADGKILNTMGTSLRKDNTGYDLGEIFIGSEGTLGFVSGVSILCAVRPKAANLIFIACSQNNFQNVIEIFKFAKRELGEILSAFEFIDRESMWAVNEQLKIDNPFSNSEISKNCMFYCLVETHGSCNQHDIEKIESFFHKLTEKTLCQDAIIAENETHFKNLWSIRERMAEALSRDGYNYMYDISLPIGKMYDLVIDLRKRLNENGNPGLRRCVAFGHIGDSNLHLNLTSTLFEPKLFNLIEPFIYEWTKNNYGSISAEHGLGLKKRDYIYFSKPKEVVQQMKTIKQMFDPKYILNPYKTLPTS